MRLAIAIPRDEEDARFNENLVAEKGWHPLVPRETQTPFRHRMTFVYLSSGIIIRLSPP